MRQKGGFVRRGRGKAMRPGLAMRWRGRPHRRPHDNVKKITPAIRPQDVKGPTTLPGLAGMAGSPGHEGWRCGRASRAGLPHGIPGGHGPRGAN